MIEEGEIYHIKSYYKGYHQSLIGIAYKVQEYSTGIKEQGIVILKVLKYFDRTPLESYPFEVIYYNEIYYIKKLGDKLEVVGELL